MQMAVLSSGKYKRIKCSYFLMCNTYLCDFKHLQLVDAWAMLESYQQDCKCDRCDCKKFSCPASSSRRNLQATEC